MNVKWMSLGTRRQIITATTILILITTLLSKRSINRSIWVEPWLLKFGTESESGLWYEKVFDEWSNTNPERYRRTLRLTPAIFNELLSMVGPLIMKKNTRFRKAVPAEKRLAITLKYLASGESFYSLSGQFCVGASTVAIIVKDTCSAIVYALREYMKVPDTSTEWKKIADDFYEMWDYPNCVGALDGKHVLIQPPPKSGTKFFNYQKTFSIILMALVDSHYRFAFVDVGAEGSVGDAGIWNRCDLKSKIISGSIGFPESRVLPNKNEASNTVPYHIIGDSAFQLESFLMKPYSQAAVNSDIKKRIFNYRLSRARRCVENAFGILARRFQVFRAPIRTNVETADVIVLAALSLHNWLMTDRMRRLTYCPINLSDSEDVVNGIFTRGDFRNDPQSKGLISFSKQGSNNSKFNSQNMRHHLCEYFSSSEGSRPWQNKMII